MYSSRSMQRALTRTMVTLAIVTVSTVSATPIFYSDEGVFNSATATLDFNVEGFEGIPITGTGTGDGQTQTVGGITLTSDSDDKLGIRSPGTIGDPNKFHTEGDQSLMWQVNALAGSLLIEFTNPLQAFSLDMIDLGVAGSNDLAPTALNILTNGVTENLFSSLPAFADRGADWRTFIGIADDNGISSVTINFSFDGKQITPTFGLTTDAIYIDRLQLGTLPVVGPPPAQGVSEPSMLMLLLSGLGMVLLRKKK